MTDEISTREFLQSAAFVRREYISQLRAKQFERDNPNTKTIFVFDSDVLVTASAPWLNGPPSRVGGGGYGELLPSLSSEFELQEGRRPEKIALIKEARRCESIASILANYVLDTQLKNGYPILQLPEHYAETQRVYSAVQWKAHADGKSTSGDEFERREAQRLARTLALLRARGFEKSDSVATILHNLALNLIERNSTAALEWDNYFALQAKSGGIYSTTDYGRLAKSVPELEFAFSVARKENRVGDEENDERHFYDFWRSSLERQKSAQANTVAREDDVLSLAKLSLINQRLSLKGNYRLVLVTGDQSIVRASYSSTKTGHWNGDSSKLRPPTIRHMWSFVEDALIDVGREREFIDLFQGLLVKASGRSRFDEVDTERILELKGSNYFIGMSVTELKDSRTQWHALTDKAVQQHEIKRQSETPLIKMEIEKKINESLVSQITPNWDQMIAELRESVDRQRDRAILKFSQLGLETLLAARNLGVRNPPDLMFGSLKKCNSIFQYLSIEHNDKSPYNFVSDYISLDQSDEAKSDVFDDDRRLSHLKFILLGAAFASADRWPAAYEHAKRAYTIVERSKAANLPEGSLVAYDATGKIWTNISGRESYFLAAVSRRLIASSTRDFRRSEEHLESARNAWLADKAKGTAQGIPKERFDNEDLARQLSFYYWNRSQKPNDGFDDLAKKIFVSLFQLLRRSETNSETSFNIDKLPQLTRVNIATNIIQCAVISTFRLKEKYCDEIECPLAISELPKAMAILETETSLHPSEPKDRLICTNLMRCYSIVASIILGKKFGNEMIDSADQLRSNFPTIDSAVVTDYDSWRYEKLKEFGLRLIEEMNRSRTI